MSPYLLKKPNLIHKNLPSSEELPDSDETPVDNQLQDLLPHLLLSVLATIWAERMDWYFGVDMGVYYDPDQPAIVPDAFLALGVERIINDGLRLSYVLWEEEQLPILTLEVVSRKYRNEYSDKKDFYANLGILYYVIYNPYRRRLPRFEVYKLVGNHYEKLQGKSKQAPIWLPEIGLAIGIEHGTYQGISREWVYWYNESGDRYLTPEETNLQLRQKTQKYEDMLRLLGVDPEAI